MTPHGRRAPRAFSLIEMIVVLAIIVIITMVAVLGQSNFNKTLTLTDITYTVAFSLREAQSLGLSSRVFNGIQNAAYGVHFDNDTAGFSAYSLYADTFPASPGANPFAVCPGHTAADGDPDAKPGNCIFNGPQNELVQKYSLNRGYGIARFCGHDASDKTYHCSDDSQHQIDHMDVLFQRPNTQAVIIRTNTGGGVVSLSDATIYIQSPGGLAQKCVYVSSLGQISVANKGTGNCP